MIEEAKKNEPQRLLSGLGIANVGKATARELMRHFGSIDRLKEATLEELVAVSDIGEISAVSIRRFFEDPVNQEVMERLREYGVNMTAEEEDGDDLLLA